MSAQRYICTICNAYGRNSFRPVFCHMRQHRFDAGLTIFCGLDSCSEMYTRFESFRKHVYRKHREILFPDEEHAGSQAMEVNEDDMYIPNHSSSLASGGCENEEVSLFPKRLSAKFLLKTREERKVTQSALEGIVQDMRGFWEGAIERLQEKVEAMKRNGQTIDDVLQLLAATDLPFSGVETHYTQQKFYQQHFNLLMPQARVLGDSDVVYEVPLLKSLHALLRTDVVRDEILNSHSTPGDTLFDYCDGEQYHSEYSLFSKDPCALQIQMYYDELEVCNPLGSKAKKHKLGLAYYCLGNLHPKFRSSLSCIQLLFVTKYTNIEKYGYDEHFRPILDAVLELEKEEGVIFRIDGDTDMTLRGTITTFSADNKAAWALAGFKDLGRAFRRCQYCLAVEEDMQSKFMESDFRLRTKQVYNEHCDSLNGPLREHMATTYGMWRDSELNRSKYFHVTTGMVPDIMHDILEGALELCVRHLFVEFIRERKLFTLATLNSRIKVFAYGVDIKSKPSEISAVSPDISLKQSASQMWCLGRVLPLLVGEFVDEDDENWSNFLTLLTIIDFLFAPNSTPDKADLIANLIQDFLFDFKQLYPERTLTPKMHYMIHMPTWMKWCGPLYRLWCMRFEAKHSFFKHLANILGNFKNIAKTMSERHQAFMCYQQCEPNQYLQGQPVYAKGKTVPLVALPYSRALREFKLHLSDDTLLNRVHSVSIHGTRYSKNAVVVGSVDKYDIPIFYTILEFLVSPTPTSEIFFVCKSMVTEHYMAHYHSYRVHETDTVILLHHEDLFDYHPLQCVTLFGTSQTVVMPKYHLFYH